MAVFSIEIDAILTIVVIALAAILAYLIATRVLGITLSTRRTARNAQGVKMSDVREKAIREESELDEKLKHLQEMKIEIKKRYMKGEISSQTFLTIDKENDYEIISTQAKLSAIREARGAQ